MITKPQLLSVLIILSSLVYATSSFGIEDKKSPKNTNAGSAKKSPATIVPKVNLTKKIENIDWRLSRWTDGNKSVSISSKTNITAKFNQNKIRGIAACNNYAGDYKIDGHNIIISKGIALTKKACEDELNQLETKYIDRLISAKKINVEQGQLVIKYAQGNKIGTLIFSKQSPIVKPEKPIDNSINLTDTNWQLDRATPGFNGRFSEGSFPTLSFSQDKISGFAGCNNFTGTYQIKNHKLPIILNQITLRGCESSLAKSEDEFLQSLNKITKFEINPSGELILYYVKGDATISLIFKQLK